MSAISNSFLWGKRFAITGQLSVPRREAICMFEKAGAVYVPRVTRLTDILLVGDIRALTGTTRKLCWARQLRDYGHQVTLFNGEILIAQLSKSSIRNQKNNLIGG